jgi:hypothetical protein
MGAGFTATGVTAVGGESAMMATLPKANESYIEAILAGGAKSDVASNPIDKYDIGNKYGGCWTPHHADSTSTVDTAVNYARDRGVVGPPLDAPGGLQGGQKSAPLQDYGMGSDGPGFYSLPPSVQAQTRPPKMAK